MTVRDYRWKATAEGWAYHAAKDQNMAESLSQVRCASLGHLGDTRLLYFCTAAAAKHAGAPIALLQIGSPAWGPPHSSSTNEGRVLPLGIGNRLPMMI